MRKSFLFLTVVALLAATTAQANEYCTKRWSPERGDYLDCQPAPSAPPSDRCQWKWSPERGDYQLCPSY